MSVLKSNASRYEVLSDPKRFVSAVNADLYAVTHDKHVGLIYQANMQKEGAKWTPAQIDFTSFSDDADAGQTIQQAMGFLSATDAPIIDLRLQHVAKSDKDSTIQAEVSSALVDPSKALSLP